jgi:hypothetical protein
VAACPPPETHALTGASFRRRRDYADISGPRAHARTHARPMALRDSVSNNLGVSEHPRCVALLQGGKECRSVAVTVIVAPRAGPE